MIATILRYVVCCAFVFSNLHADAQSFPNKAITIIVPFAPGASADSITRVIGNELAQILGQPVLVENKPGAGGALGLMAVSKATADGYTLGLGATGAIAINPHLPDAPPLKPKKDLVPVAKVADIPLILVASKNSGITQLKILLQADSLKSSPVSYATPGQYTSQHLAGELLASTTGASLSAVAYRGSGPAVTDLLGGNVPLALVDLTAAYPHIKAGKIIPLGVTSATRSKVAPEIPTLSEAGATGYVAPAWMGFFLPAKTPADIRVIWANALQTALSKPAVLNQITALSAEPAYLGPQAFEKFIDSESKKWASVIEKLPPPAK